MNVTSAFTALSLIALLVSPIRQVVFATPPLMAAIGCFDRIETFLSSSTKRDHRLLVEGDQSQSKDSSRQEISTATLAGESGIELDDFAIRRVLSPAKATIRVRDLTLAWSEENSPVINDVSIEFPAGQLTMVVGPVGCGKSSLLRGLLGETPSSKGNVYIERPHVAFVDQTPWIQNTSIRKNIVGVSLFEPEWYHKVVHACALDTDLDSLPDGDATNVGSASTLR